MTVHPDPTPTLPFPQHPAPKRVQMTRRRPWRAEHPDAVIVDRRTGWGNPFKVGATIALQEIREVDARMAVLGLDQQVVVIGDAEDAVGLYELWLAEQPDLLGQARRDLAGRDLACWCPLTDAEGQPVPCHADVLLRVANIGQSAAAAGRYTGREPRDDMTTEEAFDTGDAREGVGRG